MSFGSSNSRSFVKEQDLQNVRKIGELVNEGIPLLMNKFYQWMRTVPEYSIYFQDERFQQRTKEKQITHWRRFFEGNVDDEYIKERQRVGETHARIDLSLETYYSSVVVMNDLFEELFRDKGIQDAALYSSFNKLVQLDVSLAVAAYSNVINQMFKEQNNALLEMSTPVAQLWDGILFLPLVGIMDSKRAQDVMTAMLNKIAETQSKAFILDISGIAVVDTAVANHLIKITKAARLMGCLCIISGISAAVAETIVELGIQIDEVETTNTMKEALKKAFELTGMKIQHV